MLRADERLQSLASSCSNSSHSIIFAFSFAFEVEDFDANTSISEEVEEGRDDEDAVEVGNEER